ncbi:ribonuclease BN [Mycobacterium intermedium]|uniref:Ribonuclease BN n=1 Tax=Mycobacterium intermedium TaxID=28445 RepID=A0A1E3S5B2_MYCIE|nr:YhjD/YihY/BrkB family envelope integrity protein [Mycobacterium intermedium]MCV6966903.1 YihY/virulence factor BrkB family protein [Mycobacterium intermedium]ODQ97264.1 ribonuclease BN [Mycobacterium intermedium]OPE47411.1 ribonuclease BN [Mycobacterium intermedium]ORA96440.1 ribonuclease BN [Mycobacterium intermedium]
MVGWLDRLQQRNRGVGLIVAVVYKYLDDQGGYLAALITYYAFVSLFPLLLLLTTGLGVLLAGRPDLQAQVMHSALSQFPVIGSQLQQPEGLSGGTVAVVVGVLGALYGGLGVGQAVQNAMDSVWAVPRNKRRDALRSRTRSLLLLLVLGSAAIASTLISGIGHATDSLGIFGKIGVAFVAVVINAAICLVAFRLTTARELSYRQVLPGAIAAAFIWQILQWFGAGYVGHVVKSSSATNSVFALVLGLLAFLFLISSTLVLCAEINVVVVERLYPRALLTPFTDNVDLTTADRKTYTKKAKAERVKGFQRVSVKFDDPNRKPTGV